MSKKIAVVAPLVVVAAIVALAACGGGDDEGGGGGGGNEAVKIDLASQMGSDESGTATLTPDGNKTVVAVTAENAPDQPQPSHIHEGTCAKPNPTPAFPLNNVEGGEAKTTVDVSLDKLQSGTYYVNIHKSEADIGTVVACGDISGGGSASSGGGGGSGY